MKAKLAGLLVFSQAAATASQASSIDKSNYRQHLCDDKLFRPDPAVFSGPCDSNVYTGNEKSVISVIKEDYEIYCGKSARYDEARARASYDKSESIPCLGDIEQSSISTQACADKWGVSLAKHCEQVKELKQSLVADLVKCAWNEVTPNLDSCDAVLSKLVAPTPSLEGLVRMDSSNYPRYFAACDADFFKPIQETFVGGVVSEVDHDTLAMLASKVGRINYFYGQYCRTQLIYKKAIEDRSNIIAQPHPVCGDGSTRTNNECVQQAGMNYGRTCTEIRNEKKDPKNRAAWNEFTAEIKPCATVKPGR